MSQEPHVKRSLPLLSESETAASDGDSSSVPLMASESSTGQQSIRLPSSWTPYIRANAIVVCAACFRLAVDSMYMAAAGRSISNGNLRFSSCEGANGTECMALGGIEWVTVFIGVAVFMWFMQDWSLDPSDKLAWPIVFAGLDYLPISVSSSKTAMLHSWLVETVVAGDGGATSGFGDVIISLAFVVAVTAIAALIVHFAVALLQSRRTHRISWIAQYTLILTPYCLSRSAGTSWWILCQSVLTAISFSVILQLIMCCVISICAIRFYAAYGPEPLLPSGGGGGKRHSVGEGFRRSVVSFLVYATVVCTVQAWDGLFNQGRLLLTDGLAGLFEMILFAVATSVISGIVSAWLEKRASAHSLAVMTSDVLSMVSAMQLTAVIERLYSLAFGGIGALHPTFFVITMIVYAISIVALTGWLCKALLPDEDYDNVASEGIAMRSMNNTGDSDSNAVP